MMYFFPLLSTCNMAISNDYDSAVISAFKPNVTKYEAGKQKKWRHKEIIKIIKTELSEILFALW